MIREESSVLLAENLEVIFSEHGAILPTYRVTYGFPSKGGLSKFRTLGQCWRDRVNADDTHELIVSITLGDTL